MLKLDTHSIIGESVRKMTYHTDPDDSYVVFVSHSSRIVIE